MATSPGIPKGTRDFGPAEMAGRNYIFNTIRSVFRLFGYQPVETPAMENLSSLLGKYGEEGDKLLFKVLNSGDYLSKISQDWQKNTNSLSLSSEICEKGLRYDLTVPFARYVVQHRNEITFPFKRYQIQPVWRADRPQKGRYREFYQCDADVIGSDSILNEYELIKIIDDVFSKLGVGNIIKINNRKILAGIAEVIGEKDSIIDITIAIDKLDKIGLEKVNKELLDKGISAKAVQRLQPILFLEGGVEEKLENLSAILSGSETGLSGIAEVKKLFAYLSGDKLNSSIDLDLTLARGLNYYTGAIIEVKAKDVSIGSICGGGRYDDLTGVFGLPDVSGVGISFGADRIYDVMKQLSLLPEREEQDIKVLFINFGEKEEMYSISILNELRKSGISAEIYPSSAKMKKQMAYANVRKIPYVAMAGENEILSKQITLKNMESGDQTVLEINEVRAFLQDR